jgi:hypothetical protein
MRCAEVRPLVEAYVDESLESGAAARVTAHAAGCARCTRDISLARRVGAALSMPDVIRAPKGFADRVMAGVYRQALAGAPVSVPERAPAAGRAPSRVYRRMGYAFVVTATVLAASLLVPRVAYPTLFASAGMERGGTSVVKEIMNGADTVVQEILSERSNGGSAQ